MTCLLLMLVLFSPMQTECRITLWCPTNTSLFPSFSVGVQQEHTDTVQSLRFTLDFARCLMEVAGARGAAVLGELAELGDISHPSLLQQQSLVADQISSLSREWR